MMKKIVLAGVFVLVTAAGIVVTFRSIAASDGKEISSFQAKIDDFRKKIGMYADMCFSLNMQNRRQDDLTPNVTIASNLESMKGWVHEIKNCLSEIAKRIKAVPDQSRKTVLTGYVKIMGDLTKRVEDIVETTLKVAKNVELDVTKEMADIKALTDKMQNPTR